VFMPTQTGVHHQKKRNGKHQKHTKHFVKVYWPYLPLLFFVSAGLIFNSYWQGKPATGVLPYATSMSISELLSQTNIERANNGKAPLSNNAQLNQAAQAKANDMVARNYWSHNTPDGQAPWVFFDNAGYKYQKAGENLAYGFTTSDSTIAGWMNSPPHKENLLDSSYQDVGFGFANSDNFQDSGPETIVVAEYGQPLVPAAAAAPAASSTPQTAAAKKSIQQPAAAPSAAAAPTQETPAPVATPETKSDTKSNNQPVTSQQTNTNQPAGKKVTRIEAVTQGTAPWIASTISMIAIAGAIVLVLKHGFAIRKFMTRGERYVLQHVLLDATILSVIGLCFILTRTAGFIR
jgi:hypothetical protein